MPALGPHPGEVWRRAKPFGREEGASFWAITSTRLLRSFRKVKLAEPSHETARRRADRLESRVSGTRRPSRHRRRAELYAAALPSSMSMALRRVTLASSVRRDADSQTRKTCAAKREAALLSCRRGDQRPFLEGRAAGKVKHRFTATKCTRQEAAAQLRRYSSAAVIKFRNARPSTRRADRSRARIPNFGSKSRDLVARLERFAARRLPSSRNAVASDYEKRK